MTTAVLFMVFSLNREAFIAATAVPKDWIEAQLRDAIERIAPVLPSTTMPEAARAPSGCTRDVFLDEWPLNDGGSSSDWLYEAVGQDDDRHCDAVSELAIAIRDEKEAGVEAAARAQG